MYRYQLPLDLIKRDGPFKEFKQNGAIVSVDLANGVSFSSILLVHPNHIAAVADCEDLPFDPNDVIKIYQTPDNLTTRSSSDWCFFLDESINEP